MHAFPCRCPARPPGLLRRGHSLRDLHIETVEDSVRRRFERPDGNVREHAIAVATLQDYVQKE